LCRDSVRSEVVSSCLRANAQAGLSACERTGRQNGYQDIYADGNPDLGLYGILGCTEEGLDAQVLFDPFEKQLHSPPSFEQKGNSKGW